MQQLSLSFAPPKKWRNKEQTNWLLNDEEWKKIRKKILERDNFTCNYCGYKAEKYQIIDHIDGNPENNEDDNFQVICQMCNLIKHSGQGCVITRVVELYEASKFSQNDIIKRTREMRDAGKSDDEIIEFLGLIRKTDFKMDRNYLRKLFGFVTSRKSLKIDDMYNNWLKYHNKK